MKIAEKGCIAVSSALKAIMFASPNPAQGRTRTLPETRNEYARNLDKGLELEASLFGKIFETENWRKGVSRILRKTTIKIQRQVNNGYYGLDFDKISSSK